MFGFNTERSDAFNVYLFAASALGLGIVFNYLFFDKYVGISVFIFGVLAIAVTALLSARIGSAYRSAVPYAVAALCFMAMVAIRDSEFLTFLNIVASLGLLLLAAQEMQKKRVSDFKILDYIVTVVTIPFRILSRFIASVLFISRPSGSSSGAVIKKVLVGIVMAIPFLLFFGILFMSADAAFKQFVDSIFQFHIPENIFAQGVIIAVITAACLGIFVYLFNIPARKGEENTRELGFKKEAAHRSVEVSVFLWLIAGLFALFLIFQIAYLFGGALTISQENFTYAEYARKGFWELLVVSFFTLLVLLVMDMYTKTKSSRLSWFIFPGFVLVVETLVIVASAFKRLMLYQEAYGLTTLRLYVLGFIIFLALVFVVLAFKLVREKEDRFFAFSTLLLMIGFLAVFNVINPDAFITQKNIDRFEKIGKIDLHYIGTMSADAVPPLLAFSERITGEDKNTLQAKLMVKKDELERMASHWESFNFSRSTALKLLRNN